MEARSRLVDFVDSAADSGLTACRSHLERSCLCRDLLPALQMLWPEHWKLRIATPRVSRPASCNRTRYIYLDAVCNAWHYSRVEIRSIRHKALGKFAETGNPKGVIEPQRLKRMLAFLSAAQGIDELAVPPNFGFHALTGDRHGSFAMTVTRNWRLTFTLVDDITVADLDLEDYH